MDRQIVYIGQSPQDTDLLLTNLNAYIGIAKLSAAIFGTSTLFNGLVCAATSPASMNVSVGAGEIYSLQNIDDTTYGSIPANTTYQILKQGINLAATTLACPAPVIVGDSINYLVQIGFSELGAGSTVLPYYDSANPSMPFTGPNNNPVPQYTIRQDTANVAVKAGTPATTGIQTTPSPDAGFTGAYVVTVAYGQTTITSSSISTYAGAPFLTETLLQKLGIADLQSGAAIYSADTGSANVYVATLTPAITAYSTGMKLSVKIANANTTTSTLNVNALGAKTIKYTSGNNIVANDLLVGMLAQFEYDGTNFQLLNPASEDAGGILGVPEGGTGVASVTTSPTASSWAGWDANKNLSANNLIQAYATTATAAGTTTLTVSSKYLQYFTGATTQTVVLPVTSTLVLGQQFLIENRSSGVVTVQSSGANTIKAMEANTQLLVTCILVSGTSAASWDYSYSVVQGALPVADGGTGVNSVTISPTASSFAGWDANSNFSTNNFIEGYATTATAAGTTTLTVASKRIQYFTGSTTQTVVMPVTSTLVLGFQFLIENRSSGVVTVQSSGANNIIAMEANSQALLTCILVTGTSAASWDYAYSVVQGALPVADGGTGQTSVITSPTASSWVGWDANKNLSANNFITSYTTTATAAGTSTLTVSSTEVQFFTGSTTQTVKLPVTSTLVLGQQFVIANRSSGVVTVQSSGSNTIKALEANSICIFTCILITGTTAASWDYSYQISQGALPVADGGTGLTGTPTNGQLPIGNGSGYTLATLTPGPNVTVTNGSGTITIASSVCGYVNKFINPTMDIWQIGTSGAITTGTTGYSADGWIIGATGATCNWSQGGVVFGASNSGVGAVKNVLILTGNASMTDTFIKQRIESSIAAPLTSQTCTVQITCTNNSGATITPTITVKHANVSDNWGATTTDVNAVSLQSITSGSTSVLAYTFTDSGTAYNGLEITFDFGAVLNTNGKTVYLLGGDLRLSPGVSTGLNSSPPFVETRPIASELTLCQRYLQKSFPQATTPAQNAGVAGAICVKNPIALGDPSVYVQFKTTMRASPTITTYNPSNTNANWRDVTASADVTVSVDPATAKSDSGLLFATSGTVATLGDILAIHYLADARL